MAKRYVCSLYTAPADPPPAFENAQACAKLNTEQIEIESSILKVGIVGSGIAGLTAAYLLNRDGHDVTLFERQRSLGMAAHSLNLPQIDGQTTEAGDVPSRMFNDLLWPKLTALYREIGVAVEEVNPTQSLTDSAGKTYLSFSKAYRPNIDASLVFDSRSRKILAGLKKLFAAAENDLRNGNMDGQTFEEYLRVGGYTNELKFGYLYPTLSSTVCTCSYSALSDYPALLIFKALQQLTGESPLQKTVHGTSDVVSRLSKSISKICLSTTVQKIVREGANVDVFVECNGQLSEQRFDHLIVATQANQALQFVDVLSDEERRMLQSFQYENIPVIVHTDDSLMPTDRRRWATFNMVCSGESSAMCSVWMNQFHANWKTDVDMFQSIGPLQMPAEESVLGVANLQRPIVNKSSQVGWSLLSEFNAQSNRRLWFCGSYASEGVPLLESGVASAMGIFPDGVATHV